MTKNIFDLFSKSSVKRSNLPNIALPVVSGVECKVELRNCYKYNTDALDKNGPFLMCLQNSNFVLHEYNAILIAVLLKSTKHQHLLKKMLSRDRRCALFLFCS